jgi:hypothetical protein
MIKRLFGKIVQLGHDYNMQRQQQNAAMYPSEVRPSTRMEQLFGDCQPAIVAFRIENGYVMRSVDMSNHTLGSTASGYVYCKDHAAVAEHIVSEAARSKLGVGGMAEAQQKLNYGSVPAPRR